MVAWLAARLSCWVVGEGVTQEAAVTPPINESMAVEWVRGVPIVGVTEPRNSIPSLAPGVTTTMLTSHVAPCRHVRKAAVQLLTAAAHSKPGLVLDHLPLVLPLLYQQTQVNKDLIRQAQRSAARGACTRGVCVEGVVVVFVFLGGV